MKIRIVISLGIFFFSLIHSQAYANGDPALNAGEDLVEFQSLREEFEAFVNSPQATVRCGAFDSDLNCNLNALCSAFRQSPAPGFLYKNAKKEGIPDFDLYLAQEKLKACFGRLTKKAGRKQNSSAGPSGSLSPAAQQTLEKMEQVQEVNLQLFDSVLANQQDAVRTQLDRASFEMIMEKSKLLQASGGMVMGGGAALFTPPDPTGAGKECIAVLNNNNFLAFSGLRLVL